MILKSFKNSGLYLVILFLIFPLRLLAAMTSTNYQIQWDTVGSGGENTATSSSYKLRDSIGAAADAGQGTSTTYQLSSGYGSGVYDPVAMFTLYIQNSATQVAATSLSGTTVNVTTASGYVAGDYIAVVQNEGESQSANVGKITSVSGTALTVDFWASGTSLTIDSLSDYVYELSGTTIPFGTLATSSVVTAIVAWEVNADVQQGYGVFLSEDQNLTGSLLGTIADVADGTVTSGQSEYGARSSDTSLASSTFDTQDTAITSTPAQIASRTDNTFKGRDFITLKLAISGAVIGDTYAQTLAFVYVGDY